MIFARGRKREREKKRGGEFSFTIRRDRWESALPALGCREERGKKRVSFAALCFGRCCWYILPRGLYKYVPRLSLSTGAGFRFASSILASCSSLAMMGVGLLHAARSS